MMIKYRIAKIKYTRLQISTYLGLSVFLKYRRKLQSKDSFEEKSVYLFMQLLMKSIKKVDPTASEMLSLPVNIFSCQKDFTF